MPAVTRSMTRANPPPSVHRKQASASVDKPDDTAHPAEAPIEDGTCYFPYKISAELRLNIYRFLWDDLDGMQRRMHWKGGPIPNYDEDRSRPPKTRKLFDDMAILSACKFIYNEAQPELIAKSTVIVEINDIDELKQSTNILNNVRYLEMRDSKHSEGYQVYRPPMSRMSWSSAGSEALSQATVLRLQRIKTLLKQTPLLKSLIIGFEVLYVLVNSLLYWDAVDNSEAIMAQAYANFKMAGLGELSCTGIGTWRAEHSYSPVIEVKHFTVVSQFDRCKTMDYCDCRGGPTWLPYNDTPISRLTTNLVWVRHSVTEVGFLGPEAQKDCTPDDIYDGRELSDLEKTWFIITTEWPYMRMPCCHLDCLPEVENHNNQDPAQTVTSVAERSDHY